MTIPEWTFNGNARCQINGHDVEVYLTAHRGYAIKVDGDVVQTGFEHESDAMAALALQDVQARGHRQTLRAATAELPRLRPKPRGAPIMKPATALRAADKALRVTTAAIEGLRQALEELQRENAALRASLKSVTDTAGLRPGRAARVCEACGKPFTVRLSDLRAGHVAGRFCSRKCVPHIQPHIQPTTAEEAPR